MVEKDYNIEKEQTEIIFPEQFCTVETCSICKNNLYGTKTTACPLIDLRTINVTKDSHTSYVIIGGLNLLGWVVLKSDVSLSEKLNTPLTQLNNITEKGKW